VDSAEGILGLSIPPTQSLKLQKWADTVNEQLSERRSNQAENLIGLYRTRRPIDTRMISIGVSLGDSENMKKVDAYSVQSAIPLYPASLCVSRLLR
jgi:hypothetical protein